MRAWAIAFGALALSACTFVYSDQNSYDNRSSTGTGSGASSSSSSGSSGATGTSSSSSGSTGESGSTGLTGSSTGSSGSSGFDCLQPGGGPVASCGPALPLCHGSPNLLSNPSFESGNANWTGKNISSETSSTAWSTDGTLSEDFSGVAAGGDFVELIQTVNVNLDGGARIISTQGDFDPVMLHGGIQLGLTIRTPGGTLGTAVFDNNFERVRLRGRTVAPSIATSLEFSFKLASDGGTVESRVDDAWLVEVPNALANSGFDTDLSGWDPSAPTATISQQLGTWSSTFSSSTGPGYVNMRGSGSALLEQTIPVTPCAIYSSNSAVRINTDGGTTAFLEVDWLGADGGVVSAPGPATRTSAGVGTLRSDLQAPAEAVSARVRVGASSIDGGTFDADFDDVLFGG